MMAATLAAPARQEQSRIQNWNSGMKIRTLIVDDQLMARELLRRLLKNEADIEIIGMAASGGEAVQVINELTPDLVLLDVQMPELDGFAVLAEMNPARTPAVIFVTANDESALRAFDVHALDYLVKPCTPERLQRALERARDQIRRLQGGEANSNLSALVEDLRGAPQHSGRLAVKADGRILLLKMADIDWVEAADNYVNLHAGNESHLLRETMKVMENKLPPEQFLRISRSAIVNVEHVKELHPLFHGEYVVVLRNGARLTLTRGYRDKLKQLGVG